MRFQGGRQESDAHGRDDNTSGRQHDAGDFQYLQQTSCEIYKQTNSRVIRKKRRENVRFPDELCVTDA